MRLISLSLQGYRQFLERTEIEVPAGLTGICGPNGVGKSKLVEAIGYALFGAHRSLLPASDKEADLQSASGRGKIETSVSLVIEARGERYRIVRTRKAKNCCIELVVQESDGATAVKATLATTPTAVTKKVIELFGITPEAYLRTFVARQKEVAGIQSVKSGDRQKLINRLIGIAQIEKACTLAEANRKQRNAALDEKIADEGDGADVALAQEKLSAAKAVHALAVEREMQAADDIRRAHSDSLACSNTKALCVERCSSAQAIRQELASLPGAASELGEAFAHAVKQRDEAQAAATAVDVASKTLEQTAHVPDEVKRFTLLQELGVARERLEAAATSLSAARRDLEAYHDCNLRFDNASGAMSILKAESSGLSEALKSAKEGMRQAHERHSELVARLDDVRRIGAAGFCERCGQALGERFTVVVTGLEAEVAAAASAVDAASSVHDQVSKSVSDVDVKLQRAEADLASALRDRAAIASAPGQLDAADERHRACASEILRYPAELIDIVYNPAEHTKVDDLMRQRNEAAATVRSHSLMAAGLGGTEIAVERAKRLLDQNTTRQGQLRADLAKLTDVEEARDRSMELLEEAERQEIAANEQWKKATTARAQADAAIDNAAEAVTATERRALRIVSLRNALEVSERTEVLLRATRDEITGEARPHLSDLLDGWARSLMGEHFRRVQLTSDYRIEADNGSGLHTIEHFSGGEQTLLAVMLRVAISQYCQERSGIGAGFLILDEVFGDQDELHRAQLVQFLNEIKPHYHQILIVNHVQDVTDCLGSIIDVSSVGEKTSKALLRL